MKRYIWTALVLLALTPRVGAGAEPWREISERVVEPAGFKGLKLENRRGWITVRPSTDGRIHITALKIVRAPASEQTRLSEGTQVETMAEQGLYVVRVRYPQQNIVRVNFWDLFSGFEMPRVEVRLTLAVPSGLTVWAMSSSGDLRTEDLSAGQVLTSSSGDISVQGARGAVEVSTSSGDITATDLVAGLLRSTSGDIVLTRARGPVVLRSTSGDVSVKDAADTLSIDTASGDIRVERAPRGISVRSSSGEVVVRSASGTVTIDTASGDVQLGLGGPLRRSEIGTGSGDIEVGLSPGLACNLDLRTSSGTLELGVPVQVKSVSRHDVSAVVGRGGPPVLLHSSSGDIHVTSGGK